jgi:hypothetical protein
LARCATPTSCSCWAAPCSRAPHSWWRSCAEGRCATQSTTVGRRDRYFTCRGPRLPSRLPRLALPRLTACAASPSTSPTPTSRARAHTPHSRPLTRASPRARPTLPVPACRTYCSRHAVRPAAGAPLELRHRAWAGVPAPKHYAPRPQALQRAAGRRGHRQDIGLWAGAVQGAHHAAHAGRGSGHGERRVW